MINALCVRKKIKFLLYAIHIIKALKEGRIIAIFIQARYY